MPSHARAEDSIWSMGRRTLTQAQIETGLSKQELTALCDEGTLVWVEHGGRRTKLIAWKSLVLLMMAEHAEFESTRAGADARTPDRG